MGHRKTIRHFHQTGHLHEFTFSCYQRRPLLTNDIWREKLALTLDVANRAEGLQLVAFVFMPEHVHLLTYPLNQAPKFGRYLARIKQALVDHRSALLTELTVQERPGKQCFRYWQEGAGFDRNIFSKPAIQHSLAYIHENPVKRGMCQRAVDWLWSSARYYELEPPEQQDPDLPIIHGLPTGVLD